MRIVGALESIASQMSAVRDLGIRSEAHLSNLAKVNERVSHFKGELEKIRAARLTVSPDALGRSLGDDANRVFAAYRAEFAGKNRTVVDLGRLGELCDALHEIVRTMQPLAGDTNARNVAVVLDQLSSFEREHARIRAARASAA